MTKLAVIGCGISGVLTAKAALENNFDVVIFEQNSEIGGIWSNFGHAWPGMIANSSKFAFNLSDFQWPGVSELFPSRSQVQEFIHQYCKTFDLLSRIKYSSKINLITLLRNLFFFLLIIVLLKYRK